MKNYSDLPDTDLKVVIELETIGEPNFALSVLPSSTPLQTFRSGEVLKVYQTYFLDPHSAFSVIIELQNKIYTTQYETAVVIKKITVDNIDLIPSYSHLATYRNDHQDTRATNYLGFNGKWTLTIDRPFYQWLHQVSGQGWLLS